MAKNETLTYTQAENELENIVAELEKSDCVNFDDIKAKVARATELLKFCNHSLHETDKEVENLLSQLNA